jgi:hypothetical protein
MFQRNALEGRVARLARRCLAGAWFVPRPRAHTEPVPRGERTDGAAIVRCLFVGPQRVIEMGDDGALGVDEAPLAEQRDQGRRVAAAGRSEHDAALREQWQLGVDAIPYACY